MEFLYEHTEKIHNTRAASEVVPLLITQFAPGSILDVGCGTGTWMKVFCDHGVTDVLGIDGDYVDRAKLKIPERNFMPCDLRVAFALNRKFDLVICLEVAEHLPEASAETLVASLTTHGDHVVFSAAIPGQGGQNHLNEQWPGYWEALFKQYNFVRHDQIRPQIWRNSNVDIWYRQNMYVFARTPSRLPSGSCLTAEIHPELWAEKIDKLAYVQKKLRNYEVGNIGFLVLLRLISRVLRRKLKPNAVVRQER